MPATCRSGAIGKPRGVFVDLAVGSVADLECLGHCHHKHYCVSFAGLICDLTSRHGGNGFLVFGPLVSLTLMQSIKGSDASIFRRMAIAGRG
jgi:hypothetical protein